MARWWDSDKAIARGASPGTRAGRAVRFASRPPSRDTSTARPPRLDPPPGALALFRPRLALLRPTQWIAVTADVLEARDHARIWTVRRSEIEAIRLDAGIVLLGAANRTLASIPDGYPRAAIDALAAILGVRVTSV
jgi:hypothetical protein